MSGRCGYSLRPRRITPIERSAIGHVAQLLGMSPETLRLLRRRVEVDTGQKPGVTGEAAEEIKRLKRENAELRLVGTVSGAPEK